MGVLHKIVGGRMTREPWSRGQPYREAEPWQCPTCKGPQQGLRVFRYRSGDELSRHETEASDGLQGWLIDIITMGQEVTDLFCSVRCVDLWLVISRPWGAKESLQAAARLYIGEDAFLKGNPVPAKPAPFWKGLWPFT